MADAYSFPVLEGRIVGAGGSGAAARAVEILADAELQAAGIRDAAFQRGQAEGYAAGVADAVERVEAAVVALQLACASLAAAMDERVSAVERDAVELALQMADKIVATALEISPELVVPVVAGTLRGLTERDHVVVEVSPDDIEVVRTAREDLVERLGGFTRVEIVPERRVPRGGCVVQTSEGEIDGRPGLQLDRLAEVVREALGSRDE